MTINIPVPMFWFVVGAISGGVTVWCSVKWGSDAVLGSIIVWTMIGIFAAIAWRASKDFPAGVRDE